LINLTINDNENHMKILVCIKEVVDPSSALSVTPCRTWVEYGHTAEYRMNRYDEYALEEALLIKEAHGDVTVDAVSVGPPRVKETLKRAMGKGADTAVHILYPEQGNTQPGYMDAHLVSSLIAEYAAPLSYDLIFTGVMAEDDMQCTVGPLIAARLDNPCAVSVVAEVLNIKDRTITVDCEMEGGMSESVVLSLPALLTIQSGINQPRYPSLSNMLRSKGQDIATVDPEPGPAVEKRDAGFAISLPVKDSTCNMITGTSEKKAETLATLLRDKMFVK
jgi:electron transfer flavoprotein beta subunit